MNSLPLKQMAGITVTQKVPVKMNFAKSLCVERNCGSFIERHVQWNLRYFTIQIGDQVLFLDSCNCNSEPHLNVHVRIWFRRFSVQNGSRNMQIMLDCLQDSLLWCQSYTYSIECTMMRNYYQNEVK